MWAQVQVQTQQAQEEKSDAMNTLSKFAIIAILVGIIICFYQVMILAVTTPIPEEGETEFVEQPFVEPSKEPVPPATPKAKVITPKRIPHIEEEEVEIMEQPLVEPSVATVLSTIQNAKVIIPKHIPQAAKEALNRTTQRRPVPSEQPVYDRNVPSEQPVYEDIPTGDDADLDFYETIIRYNIFQPLGWRPRPTAPQYELIGTLVSADSANTQAFILDRSANRTHTVQVGDKIDDDVLVEDIQEKRVILQKKGDKTIILDGGHLQFSNF